MTSIETSYVDNLKEKKITHISIDFCINIKEEQNTNIYLCITSIG